MDGKWLKMRKWEQIAFHILAYLVTFRHFRWHYNGVKRAIGGNMGVRKWLLTVALKKGLKRIVPVIVAFLLGPKVAPTLGNLGVTLDATQLTVALTGGLEVLRNFVKHKMGVDWL